MWIIVQLLKTLKLRVHLVLSKFFEPITMHNDIFKWRNIKRTIWYICFGVHIFQTTQIETLIERRKYLLTRCEKLPWIRFQDWGQHVVGCGLVTSPLGTCKRFKNSQVKLRLYILVF